MVDSFKKTRLYVSETLGIEADRVAEIGAEPNGYAEIDGQYIGLLNVRSDYRTFQLISIP